MQERVSKTSHQYAGRDLSKGDRFEVEPQHVPLLLALGRIEAEVVAGEHGEYLTREMTAAAPAECQRRDLTATPHVKRGYKRKAR